MTGNKPLAVTVALILAVTLAGCGATPAPSPTLPPAPPPTLAPTPAPTLPAPPPTPTQAGTSGQGLGAATPPPPAAINTPALAGKEVVMNLTWLGQSTFILAAGANLKVLLDPLGAGVGYATTPVEGVDLITLSHEHSDHNNVGLATGSPLVLRGLTAGGDWAKIDQTVQGVRVRTVSTYHDDTQGSQRGKNAVFILEMEGLRLAHLGDLGHSLTPEQVKAVGPVDVILIPVGGFYTIDGKVAAEVVSQLNPRVVVPMHFKTPDLGASLAGRLAPVETFTSALAAGSATVTEAGHTISLQGGKLPAGRTIMVMKYK